MSSWRKSAIVCKHSGNALLPLGRHAAISSTAIVARFLIGFMSSSNLASNRTPCMNCSPLEAFQPKSARIEENEGSVYFLNAMFLLQIIHSLIEAFIKSIGDIEALWLAHYVFIIRL